jgi:broad specificity phosphatase PhoE
MAGAVILARHGEPALSRRVTLSAAEYRQWWRRYEDEGLKAGQVPPPGLVAMARGAGTVFSSTRLRSVESARAISEGRPFSSDAVFIEAPLPPPHFADSFKLTPRWWGVVARFWWRVFDFHDGEESRAEAASRATRAARILADAAAGGEDVVLIAHGYFNFMIGRALTAQGWRRTLDQGFQYWSARRFEPPLRPATAVG